MAAPEDIHRLGNDLGMVRFLGGNDRLADLTLFPRLRRKFEGNERGIVFEVFPRRLLVAMALDQIGQIHLCLQSPIICTMTLRPRREG